MGQISPDDFEILLQAGRLLSSTLDVEELLRTVMKMAAQVVKAEAASILLLDEATSELYFDVALGDAGGKVKPLRLKVGEGLAGWVAQRREAAVVNDVKADTRWSGRGDAASEFDTRQILAVPLIAKGRLIGVVEALNHLDGSPFSPTDLNIFEAFASQAAVAIENARLFAEIMGEKEKLATIFVRMSDGAVLLDVDGRVQLMNQAAGTLFGLDPARCLGQPLSEIVQGFMAIPPLAMLVDRREPTATSELKRLEGKAFYLSCAFSRLTGVDGRSRGDLLVVRDVTDIRKEELLKRNFLSLVSHKLKTPLVTIAGYAPLLLEDISNLTEFQVKALNTIKTQGLYLSSLVDKLISFSVVESETLDLVRRPSDLHILLSDVLLHMKTYLDGKSASVEVSPAVASLPKTSVDADRLREVFRNLIENAVKFNPRDVRRVWIDAECRQADARFVVRDDGPGIPPEEQRRIFQKFYQIEDSFTGQVEGAGLGLALVRRIVESHGGTVGVTSEMGHGSAFFFTLPLPPVV
jgi:PAS domain S-box-containing protein